jgi:hypothetical protein
VLVQVNITAQALSSIIRSISLVKNGTALTSYTANSTINGGANGILYIHALVQLTAADQLSVSFTGKSSGGDTLVADGTSISLHFMSL